MALVDVRGFNVNPDIGQNILQGVQEGAQLGQLDRNAQIRQLLGQVGTQKPQTAQQQQLSGKTAEFGGDEAVQPPQIFNQEELFAQAKQIDPLAARKQMEALGFTDDLKRAEASRFAFQLQNTPFEKRPAMINARSQSLISQGRDGKDTLELLNLDEAQQNQALQNVQLLELSGKDRVGLTTKSESFKLKQEGLDLKRQDQKLRAREAELRDLERKERLAKSVVQRDKLNQEIEKKKLEANQDKKNARFNAQSAISAVEDTADTIDRMLLGRGLESATGIESLAPTIPGTEAADFEALLETLQSQTFLAQIEKMKGMGALSENEGKKLGAAIGSLNLSMGDKTLRTELSRIKTKVMEARDRMKSKFKNILNVDLGSTTTQELQNMTVEQLKELRGK